MDVPPEVVNLGVRLTEVAARNGAAMVADRVRAVRKTGRQDEAITALEELVNELIDDKNELTRIAQAYQSELVSQRLTAGDVQYIANTVVPLLESLADRMGEDGRQFANNIDKLKPLLSVETVNVLQLLGFDFKRAIGEPLTVLLANKISAPVNRAEDLQLEGLKNQQMLAQVALDPEAYARFMGMLGR